MSPDGRNLCIEMCPRDVSTVPVAARAALAAATGLRTSYTFHFTTSGATIQRRARETIRADAARRALGRVRADSRCAW